jgi:hypothetical protein
MSRANLSEPPSEESSEANFGAVTAGYGPGRAGASLDVFEIRS